MKSTANVQQNLPKVERSVVNKTEQNEIHQQMDWSTQNNVNNVNGSNPNPTTLSTPRNSIQTLP